MQNFKVGDWVIYDDDKMDIRFTGVLQSVNEDKIVIASDYGVFYSIDSNDPGLHLIDKSWFNVSGTTAEEFRWDALLEYVDELSVK